MREKGNKALGKRGEDLACAYLCSHGHRILERNWRGAHLEIDIISEDRAGLHFVEVKSRTAPVLSTLDEQAGAAKQRHVADAALKYLNTNYIELASEVFFDLVSVVFDGEDVSVKYVPGAWIPLYT